MHPYLYHLVNKANLVHNFSCMFISILYMFRAAMCPSSGEITVSMRHLVFVTLRQDNGLKLQRLCYKMEGISYIKLIKCRYTQTKNKSLE